MGGYDPLDALNDSDEPDSAERQAEAQRKAEEDKKQNPGNR